MMERKFECVLKPLAIIAPLDPVNELILEIVFQVTIKAVRPPRSQFFQKLKVMDGGEFCQRKKCGSLVGAGRWMFPLQWLPMICLGSCKYPQLNSELPQATLG